MDYQAYITSSRWRNSPARIAELCAAGYRCRICNQSDAEVELQVHHRTYERLGCELPGDLLCVCAECHYEVTSFMRRRRYLRSTPRVLDLIPALEGVSTLHDPTR
jgi:hypothetical protein